jgi:polyisoprenoid-binding protein YceI
MRYILAFAIIFVASLSPVSGLSDAAPVAPERGRLVRYVIDAGKSKFMIHADRAGLAWFRGHSHRLAASDISGEASLTLDAAQPATLRMSVRTDSIGETDPAFTPQQKQIIDKEVKDLVLESAKYPAITFVSTRVSGQISGAEFDVRITGNLELHGVTREIKIPARVTISGDTLRARGSFVIDRKDFKVNATDAFHGLVRVKHHIKIVFDVVAVRG